MSKNYNCDGAHCTDPKGEVRTYKLGAGGNLILCKACWTHENAWRCEQAKIYDPENWPQIDWNCAEVYNTGIEQSECDSCGVELEADPPQAGEFANLCHQCQP